VKTALSDGSSKITIQLNPPDLGKVDVRLEIGADGKTSGVTITASNQDTLNLLQRDAQGLTRALNDAGLTTDSGSLNFSLGGGQQNQTQAGTQQAATTYQQAQPEEDDPVTAINAITRSYVVNLAEGLDITI
jgi:flagellar hook-length control protein FliK